MARKCDSAKYKKRRQREHLNSINRKVRIQKEQHEYYARISAVNEQKRIERREKQPLYQNMGNLLTKRICELEPRYIGLLHLRTMLSIASLFGVNPKPDFPVLYNEVYEQGLEEGKGEST